MKTTDWFPPETKPVRKGWYKRRYILAKRFGAEPWLNYFDGNNWHHTLYGNRVYIVPKRYMKMICDLTCCKMEWCGLAEEPK